MKPVSANSPPPSLSRRGSAVPSTAAPPALWRRTSTKQVKVRGAGEGRRPEFSPHVCSAQPVDSGGPSLCLSPS